MKIKFPCSIPALSLAVMAASAMTEVHAEDIFYDALTSGKASLDSRMRYENVDLEGAAKKASALTVRTRLGYKTAEMANISAFVEMSDTRIVAGVGDYRPNNANYPVVADPELTELNQAYLSFQPLQGLQLIGGRQRLILDNARFIGNVGWRQQEQTFDALTVNYSVANFDSTITYSGRRNTILGGHISSRDVFSNLAYTINDLGKITTYYYALDDNAGTTLDTMGLRFTGYRALADTGKLIYSAEFATQDTDSTRGFSADYVLAELGYGMNVWSLLMGYELQGSDDGHYGFQTSYGTNHAFAGWADKFLSTPNDGLKDVYVKAELKALGMKFMLLAHDFSAEHSGDDLGSEVDFLLLKPFAKKYKVGFKVAAYQEGDVAMNDTKKYWLWAEMKF